MTVAAAWTDERQQLTPIAMPFDSYVEQALRVSSTCLVTIERNRYSVPAQWAGKVVSVRVSTGQIRAFADGAEIARHDRRFGRDQWICEPWHYVPILQTKPVALRHGRPFVEWVLPAAIETVCQTLMKQAKGDRAFADLLLIGRETGLEALEVACQRRWSTRRSARSSF
ncbi:Mu transposase domain-containing protein [Chromobacterium haemolyticum]|uniref:Mu transposase domain-containing protein n=1 Tax=Chromobacterium haemolyticum TaxID=394935 RepID=UPI000A56D0D2|nr:hypothetical protein [Chromobacterium haemolyticum]